MCPHPHLVQYHIAFHVSDSSGLESAATPTPFGVPRFGSTVLGVAAGEASTSTLAEEGVVSVLTAGGVILAAAAADWSPSVFRTDRRMVIGPIF